MAINPTLRELKKALGADYRIYNIDLEQCLYRDYGNGFDVEISDVSRANRKCPATLYLWFTGDGNPMIVKTVHNVGRTADAIAAAADELYALSQRLIATGCNNRRSLIKMRH